MQEPDHAFNLRKLALDYALQIEIELIRAKAQNGMAIQTRAAHILGYLLDESKGQIEELPEEVIVLDTHRHG